MRFIFKNNIYYSMPILDDLSQGSRIAYIIEAIKEYKKSKH